MHGSTIEPIRLIVPISEFSLRFLIQVILVEESQQKVHLVFIHGRIPMMHFKI